MLKTVKYSVVKLSSFCVLRMANTAVMIQQANSSSECLDDLVNMKTWDWEIPSSAAENVSSFLLQSLDTGKIQNSF